MAVRASRSTARRIAARAAVALAILSAASAAAQMGPPLSANQLSPSAGIGTPARPSASANLWDAQPGLLGQSLAQLPARLADRPNIYAVAIAPLGTQTLFSREAKAALQVFADNYGGTARGGILLSNFTGDLMQVPLATQQNVTALLGEIGKRVRDAPDDIVMVYLTSHGGRDAALESALPRNLPILAISAESMAVALDEAGIRRRILIISACFAGSWIPRLANDDTIIIAAAAADRTSFGCADDRPLTYFGEAFLTGPFSRGASLAEAFEATRKTVTQWEEREKLLNSLPQAHVGRNMQAFWQAAARPAAPPVKKVAARR